MTRSNKTKGKKPGRNDGWFYFGILILCLLAVVFFAYRTFAGELILGAKIEKIEEITEDERITIRFNLPVASISLENIAVDPFIGFSYELSEDKKELAIIPNGKFALGQKYVITLKDIQPISGFPIGNTKLAFYTERAKKTAGEASEKAGEEEFSEFTLARDKYVPPATSAVSQPVEIAPHFSDGKYIDVSIGKQVMTLFEDGRQINQFLVSTGRAGMPTPTGEFKVLSKEKNHWSAKYKL
jgi:hypothetical protein